MEVARELLAGYGEWPEWRDIRERLTSPEQIDCRRFSHLLVERPWHRGRVVLIGDAAHSHPPTLTQGAAMGLEDASVLAELLTTHEHLDQDLSMPSPSAASPGSARSSTPPSAWQR